MFSLIRGSDLIGKCPMTLPSDNIPRKSAKISAIVPGGHLARSPTEKMVTLILLCIAIKSFKAN